MKFNETNDSSITRLLRHVQRYCDYWIVDLIQYFESTISFTQLSCQLMLAFIFAYDEHSLPRTAVTHIRYPVTTPLATANIHLSTDV